MYLCDKCEVYLNCRDLLVLLLLVPFCRRRLGRLRKEKILMGKGVRVSIVANDGREIFGNEDFGILPSGLRSIFQQNDDDRQEAIKALGGVTNICKLLRTDPTYGIEGTASDIMKRLQTYGINHILWVPPKSFFYFVWEAMMDPLLLVLMCAALAAIGLVYIPTPEDDDECDDDELEALIEGGSIFLSVTAIILVGAFNNYHKERQFKKLQRKVQSEHHVTVIRQGKQFHIEACNVVVGDICELYAGEKVPADGLITKSQELYVDESSFTGLTRVTKKGPNNLVLIGGTYVTQGSCEMVVCAVGDQSQQGLLLTLLVPRSSYDALEVAKSSLLGSITLEGNPEDRDPEERDEKSILQKKIEKLLFIVAVTGTVCATVTIVVQMVRFSIKKFLYEQKPWSNKYLNQYLSHIIFGFSVLVLCIPEGLPLAIAITLSYAVQGMMKNNNLVRHLNSCETMGNATIICTDKTGTLTTNRMTVTNAYICGTLVKTFKLGSLRTIPDFMKELVATGLSVHISYKTTIQDGSGPVSAPLHLGSKTECALLAFVKVLGADYKKIRSKYPEDSFEKIYPFDDVKKKRSTVVKIPGLGYRAHCTGSPDVVIPQCSFIHGKDGILETFTEEMKSKMLTDVVYSMGSSGLRIICLAYREFVHSETPEVNQTAYSNNVNWNKEGDIIKNLTFVATFGMEDPIRPEVPEAIKDCHRAGIRVCMITGDSVTTAQSVATMSGIIQPGDESLVLDVTEFKKMVYVHGKFQQELFDKIWPDLKVLAGTTHNDKYTVVNGIIKSKIHNHGEVVAYTGDGSNDVPALLRADVGFSMMLVVLTAVVALLPWAALADCPPLCRCSSSPSAGGAVCSTLDPDLQHFDPSVRHVTVRGATDLVLDLDTFPRLGLGALASLDLVNCSFRRVHVAAFAALPELTRLNMTSADLRLLHPDMFANNSRLESLSLRGAPLRLLELEPSPFQRYLLDAPSLTELDLRGCQLGRVGDATFARMRQVENVDLGDNGLREVGAAVFAPLEALLTLDLADNLLERLQVTTNVATLVLDGNPLTSLRGVAVPAVDTLHASRCRLRRLQADELAAFPQLTNLYLRDNQLEDLHEDAFFANLDLQNVDLSRNRLRGPLPAALFRNNSGLSRLSLADNPTLGVFAEGPLEGAFPLLSFLDLSRCGLLALGPQTLQTFDGLRFLKLAGNRLSSLAPGVVPPGVVSLDLADNSLTRVAPDIFPQNSNLKKLILSRNPLRALDAAPFARTPHLRELELRGCGLTALWPDAAPGALPRLLFLDVADNALARVSPSQLAAAPELDGLDLAGNPLDCEALEDLLAYLVQQDVKVAGQGGGGGALIDDDRVFVNGDVDLAWSLFADTLCGPAKVRITVSDDDDEEDQDDDDDDEEDEEENLVEPERAQGLDGDILRWVVALSIGGVVTFFLTWAVVWLCHRRPRAPTTTTRRPILRRHRTSAAYETLYEHLNSPTTPVMVKANPLGDTALVGKKTSGAEAV